MLFPHDESSFKDYLKKDLLRLIGVAVAVFFVILLFGCRQKPVESKTDWDRVEAMIERAVVAGADIGRNCAKKYKRPKDVDMCIQDTLSPMYSYHR